MDLWIGGDSDLGGDDAGDFGLIVIIVMDQRHIRFV